MLIVLNVYQIQLEFVFNIVHDVFHSADCNKIPFLVNVSNIINAKWYLKMFTNTISRTYIVKLYSINGLF